MSTSDVDIYANIPSNAPEDMRVMLRIAYVTMTQFSYNVIQTYKVMAGKNAFINYTNAMKWYNSL